MKEIYCIVTTDSVRGYCTSSTSRVWFETFKEAESYLKRNVEWLHDNYYDTALIERVTSGIPRSEVIKWYKLCVELIDNVITRDSNYWAEDLECPEDCKNTCNFAFSY